MDHATHHSPVLFESIFQSIAFQIRKNKLPLSASFVFGFLAYMFAFTNKLINHDEAGSLFSKGAALTSGRWGLDLLSYIFPDYSMPWIYGIMTIVLIAISICLIIHVFSIHRGFLQVLLAGGIMVFPSLIGTLTYMFTSTSYGVSFFLAVLSVWLITKSGRRGIFPALVCMVLSLGIYQAYVSIAASLLILFLIQQLLEGEEPLAVFHRGFLFVCFLLTALVVYYGTTTVLLHLNGKTFNSYASSSLILSPSSLISSVAFAYKQFILTFLSTNHWLIPNFFSFWIHILLLCSIAILFLVWLLQQKRLQITRLLLLALLLILLPLAINCMYLIFDPDSIHALVLYGYATVYVLAVMLCDSLLSQGDTGKLAALLCRFSVNTAAFTLSAIILVNTYVANAAYLNLHLRYENAYAFYSSLMADLKMMPEFNEETKIAIVGKWEDPDFYGRELAFAQRIAGTLGFTPDDYTKQHFLKYYLGYSIDFATGQEVAEIAQTQEYLEMERYPYYGSMKMIDNILVVKLS